MRHLASIILTVILIVLCAYNVNAYSRKTQLILDNLSPDYVDKYRIAFESIYRETDYFELGKQIVKPTRSPFAFVNYVTNNPFETQKIKNRARIEYNYKLINNIESYIRKNRNNLNYVTIQELEDEIYRLQNYVM
jgi:hypothetical protein